MKKYRFNDPSNLTVFQKARPFIYLFVGWNIFAVLGWKYLSSNAAQRDPAWETRSEGEKIAALTGSSNLVKYKFSVGKKNDENE